MGTTPHVNEPKKLAIARLWARVRSRGALLDRLRFAQASLGPR